MEFGLCLGGYLEHSRVCQGGGGVYACTFVCVRGGRDRLGTLEDSQYLSLGSVLRQGLRQKPVSRQSGEEWVPGTRSEGPAEEAG